MDKIKEEKIRLKFRQAFRFYEQVELVFHKIEFNQEQLNNANFNNILSSTLDSLNTEALLSFDETSFEPFPPASYSQKNETLKANIREAGLSFTCKEALLPDDYLIISVQLLSSRKVITTCCKVVGTKPSNPFEKNQYPYTVDAQFIKLKQKDKAVLEKYVHKERTKKFILNSLLACFILFVIQAPDLIFEVTTNFFSFVIDEGIELFHLLYETVEYGLDLIIEHTFHTDVRTTQTIVFYLEYILLIALLLPYIRRIFIFGKRSLYRCKSSLYRKKSSLLFSWREQSLLRKVGKISLVLLLTSIYILFFI